MYRALSIPRTLRLKLAAGSVPASKHVGQARVQRGDARRRDLVEDVVQLVRAADGEGGVRRRDG